MIYWRLALVVALASSVVAAVATATLIAAAAPWIASWTSRLSASRRGLVFLSLRLAPSLAGVLCAAALVLPTFVYFEPRDTHESIAWTLVLLAGTGAAAVLRAGWRLVAVWRATRSLGREWRARGRRLGTVVAPIPAFAIDDAFPRIAVVGFRHPEIFVAERVLQACSEDALRAMLLHERSHVQSGDNLKRLLVRCAPAVCSQVEAMGRTWAEAAEEAADDSAAAGHPELRITLAQALVTMARLMDGIALAPSATSAFYLGGSIENRVRRLLASPGEPRPRHFPYLLPLAAFALIAVLVAVAPSMHELMESAVRWLP